MAQTPPTTVGRCYYYCCHIYHPQDPSTQAVPRREELACHCHGLGASGIEHDLSLVELHREQLIDVKKTLASIHDDLLALDLEDDDDLFIQLTKLEHRQFDCSHKTKKLLGSSIKETPAADGKGSMKLPKLDVPTFDGDLLN